jgi:glyoxylase-like metal-dependent hydrolase (beta-lactamase superfamily II)
MARERDVGRGERVLPGLFRLRLPLPLEGVPHCNAWAVARDGGVVLFDTGMHHEGSLSHLERAMADVGLALEQVQLIAVTHAHQDHWGQAGPIKRLAGCEVWIHPNVAHAVSGLEDPQAALQRRVEIGRRSGVSETALSGYAQFAREHGSGVAEVVQADRALTDGVVVESDLGPWRVYETPGHAPSHVCFHQRERRLLISGDHLMGRVSLYFDYGFSNDPVGEFLSSLGVIEPLDVRLCLSGHGRTFTDYAGHITANRERVAAGLAAIDATLAREPATALGLVHALHGEELSQALTTWQLIDTLAYLRHLELSGRVAGERIGDVELWRAVKH